MGSAHPELLKRDAATPINFLNKLETTFCAKLGMAPWNMLVEVPATTLDTLVDRNEIRCVDLFVLNVEGLELELLKGFSFSPKPRLMFLETRSCDAAAIAIVMLNASYVLARNVSNSTIENNSRFSDNHQDFVWVSAEDSSVLHAVWGVDVFGSHESSL